MAGGIDWFRWHHGSVTDPKFALVAKKAGARLGDVVTVWAFLLESASASSERGEFGDVDSEALDCLLGADDGTTDRILDAMQTRGLISDGRVAAWDKRQPKRERDDDLSTDRVRAFRERQKADRDATQHHEAPRNDVKRHETPRGEERREREETPPTPSPDGDAAGGPDAGQSTGRAEAAVPRATTPRSSGTRQASATADAPPVAGFERFWAVYPRRVSRGRAEKAWAKLRPDDALVDRIVQAVQKAARRDRWKAEGLRYVPHPATWLNDRGWEDEDLQPQRLNGSGQWWLAQGFGSRESALAAGVQEPR